MTAHRPFVVRSAATIVLAALCAAGAGAQTTLTGIFRQRLVASDAQNYDHLGATVAMVGDTLFVGAPLEDFWGIDSGAVYVYVKIGSTWVETQKLTASDARHYTEFGSSLAVQGDLLVVGAKGADGVALTTGAAYAFRSVGGVWTEESKFFASNGVTGDWFGRTVALSNGTAVVGALFADAPLTDSGSVWVFARTGTSWVQQAQIVPADSVPSAHAGLCVSIEGDTLAVGAYKPALQGQGSFPGTAYVYVRSGTTWTLQQKLGPAIVYPLARFGESMALQGNQLVIGAPDEPETADVSSPKWGAAYLFARSGSTWTQAARFTQSDPQANNRFGSSVAIDGNLAVIGAPRHTEYNAGHGAVYLFQRLGPAWLQRPKLTPSDNYPREIGTSLVLQGDRIVGGAPYDTVPQVNMEVGAAWFYELTPFIDYVCAGDGQGTACPCANPSPLGQARGCRNSLTPGSRVRVEGVSSIAADTIRLLGLDMPDSSALFFQGSMQVNLGAGAVFGDGLRCAGGSVRRLGILPIVFGSATYPDAVHPAPVSIAGGVAAGDVRTYQVWYRNPATFCTAAPFNLTNALQIIWQS